MNRLIACSNDKAGEGEISEGTIWNPWEERYVSCALLILRIATKREYIEFCHANDLPIRDEVVTEPHYYEIQILD